MTMNAVQTMLEARLPGLHARIEEMLSQAEALYNAQGKKAPTEFLLEHALRTSAIAYQIALKEKMDPFLPSLIALYHDAGKFHEGAYHKDEVPEEEHAANLAQRMLEEFGLPRTEIDAVLEGLRALYDDRLACTGACRIVQDADRLDKLGTLGVAAFFTKAVLRGRGLVDALLHALSRELTYALAAPHSMFTHTGRKIAREQAAKTIAFFDDMLLDLENWGIASFERRIIVLEEEFRSRDGALVPRIEVTIVVPRQCPKCGSAIQHKHRRDRGVKCEKLTAIYQCGSCDHAGETSFCLPVFA